AVGLGEVLGAVVQVQGGGLGQGLLVDHLDLAGALDVDHPTVVGDVQLEGVGEPLGNQRDLVELVHRVLGVPRMVLTVVRRRDDGRYDCSGGERKTQCGPRQSTTWWCRHIHSLVRHSAPSQARPSNWLSAPLGPPGIWAVWN